MVVWVAMIGISLLTGNCILAFCCLIAMFFFVKGQSQ